MRLAAVVLFSLLFGSHVHAVDSAHFNDRLAVQQVLAQASALSFTVQVNSYDPKTRSMNVTFLESTQVMPGAFVQAGSQGRMGFAPTARMPSTLKSGDIVRVNRQVKNGEWETTSVVLVKKTK